MPGTASAEMWEYSFRWRGRPVILVRPHRKALGHLAYETKYAISCAARHAASPQEVAEEARRRINALARAHSGTQAEAGEAGLETIVRRVLEPFEDAEDLDLDIGGEPVTVARGNVTPLGLIFYELATNAAKYGSLRQAGGRISVTWARTGDGAVRLEWSERSNEAQAAPADADMQSSGFGSVMLDAMAKRLGATIEREIDAEGLTVRLTMPRIDADAEASGGSGSDAAAKRRAGGRYG